MSSAEPKGPWNQRLHQAGTRLEEDLRRLTTYINDEIIPDVRRHGSHALRAAADELHRLAQRMDEQQNHNQQAQSSSRPQADPTKTPHK
jgi:hypothetical protein